MASLAHVVQALHVTKPNHVQRQTLRQMSVSVALMPRHMHNPVAVDVPTRVAVVMRHVVVMGMHPAVAVNALVRMLQTLTAVLVQTLTPMHLVVDVVMRVRALMGMPTPGHQVASRRPCMNAGNDGLAVTNWSKNPVRSPFGL